MNLEKHNEEDIVLYLESFADIDNYYLHRLNQSGRSLILYFDSQGVSWTLMEEDEVFKESCLQYLRQKGVPEFESIEKLKEFEEEKAKALKA